MKKILTLAIISLLLSTFSTIVPQVKTDTGSETIKIAILNNDGFWMWEEAFAGMWHNDYSGVIEKWADPDFQFSTITPAEIKAGKLDGYKVLVLIDNSPDYDWGVYTGNGKYVRDWWEKGGGIIALDSSIGFLIHWGILPSATPPIDIRTVYGHGDGYVWCYNCYERIRIVKSHQVTEGYAVDTVYSITQLNTLNQETGEEFGSWDDACYMISALPSAATVLATNARGAHYEYGLEHPDEAVVVVYEPPAGGRVVFITCDNVRDAALNQIYKNAVRWAAYGVKPLGLRAAELATAVVGKDYRTKLYDLFTHGWKDGKFVDPTDIEYLDCSGLVFWSYNKAFHATKYKHPSNPVYWEGADGQYRYNFKQIDESELRPGDVLFFDWELDGYIDHVAMYVGKFTISPALQIKQLEYYKWDPIKNQYVLRTKASDPIDLIKEVGIKTYEGEFDVIHASGDAGHSYGVRPDTVERLKTLKGFKGFWRLTEPRLEEWKVLSKSPIDLIVVDPYGFTINKETHEIPGVAYYSEWDVNDDGNLDDVVGFMERIIGDYLVTVTPEPSSLPTDTYTLMVEALINGEIITATIAENIQIANIPTTPYIIRSTKTGIIPIIPATIDFDPDTLNLKSKGQWVTVYIELPMGHGCDVSQIEPASIMLNDKVQAEVKPIEIGDYDSDSIPDLMVKFNRSAIQAILNVGTEVKVTVGGKLINGRLFEGADTIRVIS